MSATRKKVILRLLNAELHRGYLPGIDLAAGGVADLLLPDGKALSLHMAEVKHVAYVRDFNLDDPIDPERMGLRSFPSKPRGPGTWVRVHFAPGDSMEGLAAEGMSFLDSLLLDRGVFLDPPDKRGNTLRVFIPRSAMTGFEVLGTAGQTAAGRRRLSGDAQVQAGLFDEEKT